VNKYQLASGGYGSGLVPLLEHGDNLVIESDIVAKYIAQNIVGGGGEAAAGDFLYPQDNGDDNDDNAFILIDEFLAQWYPTTDIYYDLLRARSLKESKRRQKDFMDALMSLEQIFTHEQQHHQGNFLLGDKFSLAECISAPWVQRFYVTLPYFRNIDFPQEMESMGLERLSRWMQAVCDRPSVVTSKCPEEEMIAAAKRYYVSYITPGAPGYL